MKETDNKFNTVLFKLVDLLDAPDCFEPDIPLILTDLGYEVTEGDVFFWSCIWKELKEYS